MNIGEQIVADYLTHIKGCEFVQQNLQTTESQGEIDVVGLDINNRTVYFCEVAVHIQGLSYVNIKDNTRNNINKIIEKFTRIKEYADNHYRDYNHIFMFWSPIVRRAKKATTMYDAVKEFEEIKDALQSKNVDLAVVINEDFRGVINDLKNIASKETKEMKSPVMRLFQVETYLDKHLKKY